MELKFIFDTEIFVKDGSSNRTFMELKSSTSNFSTPHHPSSNRTFMELKCLNCCEADIAMSCSNRTFMELKWDNFLEKYRKNFVLIVPLWN